MTKATKKQNIIIQWFFWQFSEAPAGILRAWKNIILFNLSYFSIILLLKTLFSPWRRYSYSYGQGFDLGRYFEVFTFNLISRILGAIIRICLIILGLLTEIFIIFIGIIILISWLLLPVFLIIGLIFGIWILT